MNFFQEFIHRMYLGDVRYWHKADITELHCTCPLLGVKRT